jgi:hypothetical protein
LPLGTGSVVGDLSTHFQTQTLTGLEFSAIEEQRGYWWSNADLGYHAAKDRWAWSGTSTISPTRPSSKGRFRSRSRERRSPRPRFVRLAPMVFASVSSFSALDSAVSTPSMGRMDTFGFAD